MNSYNGNMRTKFYNRDEFVEWIKKGIDIPTQGFGRLNHDDSLEISSMGGMGSAAEDAFIGRFMPIVLPSPEQAEKWWDGVWEGNVLDCWFFREESGGVVVVASPEIWQPADSLHAKLSRDDFKRISASDLNQILGRETASKMLGEASVVGVSVRIIGAASIRTAPKIGGE